MSSLTPQAAHRGTVNNPPSRFEPIVLEPDDEWNPADDFGGRAQGPRTQFLHDRSESIIARNDSPDLGFDATVNPYRGCEHGCIYCYARPTHEYLGFSAGLDFETKIMVKLNAPALLRAELAKPKWQPQVISLSGVTDCYQPVERKLKLTRGCLEVLLDFRNPVAIVTKSGLIARDVDLLAQLAKYQAVMVYISLTTLDSELRNILEPRTSPIPARLQAIETLAQAGVPVGVLVAPVIPALNDHEMPAILKAAAAAGAICAEYTLVRLPHGVGPLFEQWLETHFPQRKEKVLNQIRAMRG
ncbi:MAG TPA: PA0069 family radical SAM protein, partial [Verrucomicrobiae bacterium]